MDNLLILFNRAKKYFLDRQPQFMSLIIYIVIVEFVSSLPYFNLLLTSWISILMVWIAASLIFRFSYRVSLLFSFCLLVLSALVLVLGNEPLAEMLANAVFFLLCMGLIQGYIGFLRNSAQDEKV